MTLRVAASLLSSSSTAMAQTGSMDFTFCIGGIVTTPNTSDARAMSIQSDGKIVVAGQATAPDGSPQIALARYNTDGSLDAAFGIGGIVGLPENNGGAPILGAISRERHVGDAGPTDITRFLFRLH